MADIHQPPTAFHFRVRLAGSEPQSGIGFSEISGLEQDRAVASVSEGVENRFSHRLPGAVRHGNLTCKRGIVTGADDMFTWCQSTLEQDMTATILPRDLLIDLLGEDGKTVLSWTVASAFPVKWTASMSGAMNDEGVALESVEFAFSSIKRAI